MTPNKRVTPDWRGRLQRRFRWWRLRFEFGRWCYCTNWRGDTLEQWWEWEPAFQRKDEQ